MDYVHLRNMATQMRENGSSYSEIHQKLSIPKSTLSYWLRDIFLDESQIKLLKKRVVERQKRGRFSTAIAIKSRRVYREKIAFDEAQSFFTSILTGQQGEGEHSIAERNRRDFFIAGISLYWSQGSKNGNSFQFSDSNIETILFMVKWIEYFIKISRKNITYRLFLRNNGENLSEYEHILDFWSKNIGIEKVSIKKTLYGANLSQRQDRKSNKGSLSLILSDIHILRTVIAWQNLLIKYYKDMQVS